MGAHKDAFIKRLQGVDRTGTVSLRDFDLGVATTLGAVPQSDPKAGQIGMFIPQVPGVCPPDGAPGVPVVFADSEDVLKDYKMPLISIRRDDITSAMERWHSGAEQYRAPGDGAIPVSVVFQGQTYTGFDRRETMPMANPYDITYTVSVKARYRGAKDNPNQANALFDYVLRRYPPYGRLFLVDSIGDHRSYEAFNEGISNIDSVGEVQEREIGFAITLRVEGELDIKYPITSPVVKVPLTARIKRL